jgi:hypothetical protein
MWHLSHNKTIESFGTETIVTCWRDNVAENELWAWQLLMQHPERTLQQYTDSC